jgi:hypothetical protein
MHFSRDKHFILAFCANKCLVNKGTRLKLKDYCRFTIKRKTLIEMAHLHLHNG